MERRKSKATSSRTMSPRMWVEEQDEDGGEEGNPWHGRRPWTDRSPEVSYQVHPAHAGSLCQGEEYERMRDELSPLNRLRDKLEQDPGLVKAIENYFATEGRDEMGELNEVRQELDAVKNTLIVEKELATVAKWVRDNDLPMFDEDELLAHAAENAS